MPLAASAALHASVRAIFDLFGGEAAILQMMHDK
jgi:hypothetical protein